MLLFLLAGVAIVAVPFALLAVLLSFWARSLSTRGSDRARALAKGIWIGDAVASLGGFAIGGAQLRGISLSAEPALKSKMVADAVAEGMNCAAFFLLIVLTAGFLGLVALEIQMRVVAARK